MHLGSLYHFKSQVNDESSNTILPRKWNDFLRDGRNVKELFDFLTDKLRSMRVPENKEVFVTSENDVIGIGTEHEMSKCNHEEADTRIIILCNTTCGCVYVTCGCAYAIQHVGVPK